MEDHPGGGEVMRKATGTFYPSHSTQELLTISILN